MKNVASKPATVRSLVNTIVAFESGTLSGAGASQKADAAIKALTDRGISPAKACLKYA